MYRRALPLLAAASVESSIDVVAGLSIGARDQSLLTLREWTFGSQLASVANCSACGERLEWTVDTAHLRASQAPALPGDISFEADGYSISFRVPNSLDLGAVADTEDAALASRVLLERCVIAAQHDGREITAGHLPDSVAEIIAQRMAEADPQGDIQIDLACPTCGHRWRALFDIESFFWSEINAWAQRVLSEVHLLACAYGWRESDILSLTPWRRQFYLGLVSG